MRDTNVNIRTTAPNRYEPAVSPAEKGKQIRTRFPRVRPSILLPLVLVFARPILSCPPQCVSPVQPRTPFCFAPPPSMCSPACKTSSRFAFLAPSGLFHLYPPPSHYRSARFEVLRLASSLSRPAIFLLSSLFLRARTRALTRARERWARKSTDDICRT